jgi:hypothetical protein
MKKQKYEDEINFYDLPKKPSRLFGWSYIYFFIILLAAGIFYVNNQDDVFINASPQLIADTIGIVPEIPLKKGGIKPALDLTLITEPTPELLEKGEELYTANCASCHGAEGRGDGAAGAALNPKPRNFLELEGWTNGTTFTGFYKTLHEGIIQNGMAAYEYLPPEDRVAMIQHVRTFTEYPEVTEAEAAELDFTYNLSEGTKIPNTIPVELAVDKIINEFNADIAHAGTNIRIETMSDTPGARLFDEYNIDKNRLIKSLKRTGFDKDLDTFIKSVCSSPIELGFKSGVVRLEREQWVLLYDYIGSVVIENE